MLVHRRKCNQHAEWCAFATPQFVHTFLGYWASSYLQSWIPEISVEVSSWILYWQDCVCPVELLLATTRSCLCPVGTLHYNYEELWRFSDIKNVYIILHLLKNVSLSNCVDRSKKGQHVHPTLNLFCHSTGSHIKIGPQEFQAALIVNWCS